jgi:hypothetical protein
VQFSLKNILTHIRWVCDWYGELFEFFLLIVSSWLCDNLVPKSIVVFVLVVIYISLRLLFVNQTNYEGGNMGLATHIYFSITHLWSKHLGCNPQCWIFLNTCSTNLIWSIVIVHLLNHSFNSQRSKMYYSIFVSTQLKIITSSFNWRLKNKTN